MPQYDEFDRGAEVRENRTYVAAMCYMILGAIIGFVIVRVVFREAFFPPEQPLQVPPVQMVPLPEEPAVIPNPENVAPKVPVPVEIKEVPVPTEVKEVRPTNEELDGVPVQALVSKEDRTPAEELKPIEECEFQVIELGENLKIFSSKGTFLFNMSIEEKKPVTDITLKKNVQVVYLKSEGKIGLVIDLRRAPK